MAITVDLQNSFYSSVDGVLFDRTQATLIQYPPGMPGNYAIPSSVTAVGSLAFAECHGVTNVTIPFGVTNIQGSAFYSSGLNNVVIPGSVTSIGGNAFAWCTDLTNVTLAIGVTSISASMFDSCRNLARITIPDGVTTIGYDAFQYDTNLFSITFPASVTSIEDYAFYGCGHLTNVYFKGNAPNYASAVFTYDDHATVYYLPGTTGWGSTFGGRPTVLWNPQAQTTDASFGLRTNQFGFDITGSSNLVIVVEACTNLANPVWSPLATNTLTSGSCYFRDTEWTNYPIRIYRLRSP